MEISQGVRLAWRCIRGLLWRWGRRRVRGISKGILVSGRRRSVCCLVWVILLVVASGDGWVVGSGVVI